jgi:hypothetical protein
MLVELGTTSPEQMSWESVDSTADNLSRRAAVVDGFETPPWITNYEEAWLITTSAECVGQLRSIAAAVRASHRWLDVKQLPRLEQAIKNVEAVRSSQLYVRGRDWEAAPSTGDGQARFGQRQAGADRMADKCFEVIAGATQQGAVEFWQSYVWAGPIVGLICGAVNAIFGWMYALGTDSKNNYIGVIAGRHFWWGVAFGAVLGIFLARFIVSSSHDS